MHNPLDHHRGPFALMAYGFKAQGGTRKLATESDRREVARLAQTFLDDPRDRISEVIVYSEVEQQHVVTFRRGGPELALAAVLPVDDFSEPTIDLRADEPSAQDNDEPSATMTTPDVVFVVPTPLGASVPSAKAAPKPVKAKAAKPASVAPAPKAQVVTVDRIAAGERKTCPYSGTKGLDSVEQECPMCGIKRTPHKENRGHGKYGPVIFPYHARKTAQS